MKEINLKTEQSFEFLKKIIIGVINSKENLKQEIQGHFQESNILEPEKNRNVKPQCNHFQKVLGTIHYNYHFSNCKNLIYNNCL